MTCALSDSHATPRPRRHRGQAGLTIIELLVMIVIGGVLLVPVLGLVTLTLTRRAPTARMNDQAAQLRLFRSHLTQDWSEARIVSTNPTRAQVECSGPGVGGATIKLVLVSSDALPKRVIYKTRTNADGTTDLVRRECFHADSVGNSTGAMEYGTRTDAAGGSDRIIVRRVKTLTVPASCNPSAMPPFTPCDMNVTLTTSDGQVATLRLHQETGRAS